MKDNQSEQSMGDQIMDALSDALQGGDFSDLNRLVTQSVTNALNEVGRHIPFVEPGSAQGSPHVQTHRQPPPPTREQMRQQEKERRQEQARRQAQQMYQRSEASRQPDAAFQRMPNGTPSPYMPAPVNRTSLLPFQFKKVGNVSNVLYQVFGGIGLGVTGLFTLFHLVATVLEGTIVSAAGWGVNLLFLALFAGMIRLGIGQRRRLKLAERYVGLCGRNLYGEIKDLAGSTGRKARRVIKDLQKMMRIGMFPEGHLDEKKTCFMLSDSIYQQYLDAENNRRLREAESMRIAEQKEAPAPQSDPAQTSSSSEQEAELNAMVAEGMECIRRLRLLNDQIPGEVISAKLDRLEKLLKEIFDNVREHPEQMHRMHKLMSYYLPTTLKLVESYAEFDRISVPGDDIIAAKAEIENTLDTINQAFTELLNNLFQDAVLDATTDAQVLKTMLASEGLMNEMDLTTNQR